MFKTWCCIVTLFFCLTSIGQNTAIPDNNFEQALIDLGLDTPPLDNQVPTTNIANVTNLDIKGKGIQDLTGIQDFKALTNLDCSVNMLTTINLAQLSNLKILWCFSNQISTLNISQNTALTALRCENNMITQLDVSNNTNLVDLACENNNLNAIDVSKNTFLSRFQCGNNALSSLNVTSNSNLSYLSCEQNQIASLNLTNNGNLKVLLVQNNLVNTLDLSKNTGLTTLNASNNQLCQLILNNGNNSNIIDINFSNNPNLNCVVVDNPNADHSTWIPSTFNNYTASNEACDAQVPVDSLDDFIGVSYTLPPIVNGQYYTQSGANGNRLNIGDIISASQTIYIYNEENCYRNESNFNVLITDNPYYIPKYFTPNNDGFNDTWEILDSSKTINNVSIFNRHGKLLKFLPGDTPKWDGTYRGLPMNTDSYWYEVVLNTGQVLRGYFALKR
ncbi:T9SS type B sorting domain-containing protein [Cognatitamlana onchidii]|uniref:T9SS type B sorting domain-containing protein n=1 Tax=Cognatitamlana onchidii TaxID=2562860 RepID=UPI0010A5AFB6|nr:T9SS type B sorting domain-containing protein [Algibacter onchidii]